MYLSVFDPVASTFTPEMTAVLDATASVMPILVFTDTLLEV